ncbi:MAG: PP2C family serine/threonine-protein phosphatase [Cyanobacteria bacterium P01_D01_bin.56]
MVDLTEEAVLLRWEGKNEPCLDKPRITQVGHVILGCYGGNSTAGAKKNEDAAFILAAQNQSWTFTSICDAHCSSESASLIVELLHKNTEAITHCLSQPVGTAFVKLEQFILGKLLTPSFQQACHNVKGETAVLLCAQKDTFLWWLSIGDNLIYLFHPEFARLGQFALNQRHFSEWIGYANSLALDVPCYTRGVTELRKGINNIMLLTDGVLEFEGSPFMSSTYLYELYQYHSNRHNQVVKEILQTVHDYQGRDSATIISFSVDVRAYTGVVPSG